MTCPSKIIDFGGSSGWCFDYLANSIPNHSVRSYDVVETEDVVNHMNKSELHKVPVKFTTINNLTNSCDILYCNGVLQYFESNATLLSLIGCVTPEYILLDELVAKSEDDFFTVQTFYDFGLPYRFIGLKKILYELSCLGYIEIIKYPYPSSILGVIKPMEMGNFPQQNQMRYPISILLKKCK
jgi:putative methyltransferase (TIGR04325 family)